MPGHQSVLHPDLGLEVTTHIVPHSPEERALLAQFVDGLAPAEALDALGVAPVLSCPDAPVLGTLAPEHATGGVNAVAKLAASVSSNTIIGSSVALMTGATPESSAQPPPSTGGGLSSRRAASRRAYREDPSDDDDEMHLAGDAGDRPGSANLYAAYQAGGRKRRVLARHFLAGALWERSARAAGTPAPGEATVPLRLDIDYEHFRLRDSILWNLEETVIEPREFAAQLLEDLCLQPQHQAYLQVLVTEALALQIDAYRQFVTYLRSDPVRQYLENYFQKNPEGVLINLDMIVGSIALKDRFVWDPVGFYCQATGLRCAPLEAHQDPSSTAYISPVTFAQQMCADLGLGGEFVNEIAFHIYEQVFRFFRIKLGYGINTSHLAESGLPSDVSLLLSSFASVRTENEASSGEWAPSVEILSEKDIERLREDRDRSARRRRRDAPAQSGFSVATFSAKTLAAAQMAAQAAARRAPRPAPVRRVSDNRAAKAALASQAEQERSRQLGAAMNMYAGWATAAVAKPPAPVAPRAPASARHFAPAQDRQ
ncbi:hypothetical protein H696_06102 [Fonticula alba]|uniref:Uncharacterized protein n=1 Tax=Fonticula alba TaxID=691883 RepID=A0A058Z0Q0_FONAL|nr:hypothetical protein H696_06102 [Fonticula alba]KCV67463.1 hypothetical protein H696_06102 [Fonticula alba]|eukprot:XP_009498139.1 hypothetical protein H696_06102 [Fonticula alba]